MRNVWRRNDGRTGTTWKRSKSRTYICGRYPIFGQVRIGKKIVRMFSTLSCIVFDCDYVATVCKSREQKALHSCVLFLVYRVACVEVTVCPITNSRIATTSVAIIICALREYIDRCVWCVSKRTCGNFRAIFIRHNHVVDRSVKIIEL